MLYLILFYLVFNSSIQNNTEKIFIECNLSNSKIILLNKDELKYLGIIYLIKINNLQRNFPLDICKLHEQGRLNKKLAL